MPAGVTRTGGAVVVGGVSLSLPSPMGEWNPQLDGQTVDFDRDAFARFISDKGYDVTWEKAVNCPNMPADTLAPRDHSVACPFCDGRGFIYFDAQDTKVLFQGIRLDQAFHAYGRWDVGQAMATALPEAEISYNDRLTLNNGVCRFSQKVRRQPGQTTDKLKYAPLTLDYVAWIDRTNSLKVFTVGTDCAVSADGSSVQWYGSLPDDGDYYVVAYRFRPRYVVLDLTHQHRDSTVKGQHYEFPVQAIVKLDFLIRDEGKDPPTTVDKSPFPPFPPTG